MGDDWKARAEAAEAELARLRALIPDEFLLVPPDGGDVHTDEAIRAMVTELARLRAPAGDVGEVVAELGEIYSLEYGDSIKAAADIILRQAGEIERLQRAVTAANHEAFVVSVERREQTALLREAAKHLREHNRDYQHRTPDAFLAKLEKNDAVQE